MSCNALSYLEGSASKLPESVAVTDGSMSLTYKALVEASKRVGTALAQRLVAGKPVVIAMEKGCTMLSVMMGTLYAGGHYVPVDTNAPERRIERILDALEQPLVVIDRSVGATPSFIEWYDNVMDVSELSTCAVDEQLLGTVRRATLESDPAYILFTSGSTGVPKGVVVSHRAICCFIDSFVQVLGIEEGDRVGNQAPFDFDVSTKDIYGSFATGATLVIIPRALFMKPMELMAYLSEQRVTVLVWAVAALCIPTTYHALEQMPLPDLRIVAFSGEIMPHKHLRAWRKHVPKAVFYNLYGPTEITCNCLYLRLDEARSYEDGIPLGESFPHCEVFLLDEKDRQVRQPDVAGELVVRGPSLALGYVRNRRATKNAFMQNPLHDSYPDRVYRTGDLACFSASGELFFRGRKDNQIKHMGHRIELEEIDVAGEQVPGVERCRCVYDSRHKRLRAFYEGTATEEEVRRYLAGALPLHMRPSTVRKVREMPLNKNGKVDRGQLMELMASSARR